MKKQVTELLDKLFSKQERPLMIGDVLERIVEKDATDKITRIPETWAGEEMEKCIGLWKLCGFTKSLQQIIETSGWMEEPKNISCKEGETNYMVQVLVDPKAQALIEFILSLDL